MNVLPGLMLASVAGAANATFALPMKFARKWAWENIWLMWSLFALLLLPLGTAILTIPSLAAVYGEAGMGTVLLVATCGVGWGLAQVLFGLSVDSIGMGLAFSIVLGLSAAVGSLLPLLRLGHGFLHSPAAPIVLLGIALVLAGVSVCAVAGRLREKAQGAALAGTKPFAAGLLMAVCSGLCAASMNFGVAFGGPIVAAASAHGASAQQVVNAVWLPLLSAGALPNLFYCIYLLSRKRTWTNFQDSHAPLYSLFALIMAILWFFSTALYGTATRWLGDLGVVVGWPVFMSMIVITASLLGMVTGEWKRSGKRPIALQFLGMLLLVLAVVTFACAPRPTRSASQSHCASRIPHAIAACSIGTHLFQRINLNVR